MTNYYDVGDLVTVQATFVDQVGNPTNPTNTYLEWRTPSGVTTTYEFGVDPEITNPSPGVFRCDLNANQAGQWNYRWYATGTGQAADESFFIVQGSPLAPGVGMGNEPEAQPLPYTWLSLQRYAQILGINPVHFMGAHGTAVWPFENNRCSNIWPRYSWQLSDQVAHMDLALAIKEAEDEISSFLGYPLAPTWYTNEPKRYPKYHRPDVISSGGWNVRGQRRAVKAKWAKVIGGGQRAVTLIDTPTTAAGELVYSDNDGDGFYETATITVTTTVTDACELKAYFYGKEGDPRWEIRPAKSKTVSGGVATLVFDSWLFIHPDLLARTPTEGLSYQAVDITTTSNYVSQVDIYREYNDNTSVSAQFFWEPEQTGVICDNCGGTGCPSCAYVTQDGCLLVRDVETGYVAPSPATYDATSASWLSNNYTVGRDPDQVKLWYYAGDKSDAFLSGDSCDPLSDFFARAICWLATARIERPFCQCGNVTALVEQWREELTKQGEYAYLFDFNLLDAPFGTKRGELMAFKALSMLRKRKISVGVVR